MFFIDKHFETLYFFENTSQKNENGLKGCYYCPEMDEWLTCLFSNNFIEKHLKCIDAL